MLSCVVSTEIDLLDADFGLSIICLCFDFKELLKY